LSGTSIMDTDTPDDGTANISTTGNVILTATSGDIGSAANELDIDTGTGANALKATASNGDIFIQEVSGAVSLDDIVASGSGSIRLQADDIVVSAGKSITASMVTLIADALDISGSIQTGTGTVALQPLTNNTDIGLGGGAGTFNLLNSEIANITADNLIIGSDTASGNIDIGSINVNANLLLNTTGNITDATPGNDATANIILSANKHLTITGGGGTGAGNVGDTASATADLDITTSGNGSVSITVSGANNVTLENTGTLRIENISSGSGNINLRGTNIVDTDIADDDTANIATTGSVSLTATTGSIGTGTNELDIDMGNSVNTLTASAVNGNIYIQETAGDLNLDDVTASATGTVALRASDITVAAAKSIFGQTIELNADEVHLFGSLNAGIGTIRIQPITGKTIQVGGTVDDADTALILDISDAELNRMTAGTVEIGAAGLGGGLNIAGNIDVSGKYNLILNNGSDFEATGYTFTLGNQNLTVNAGGFINSGSINGGDSDVSLSSGDLLRVTGPIALGNNGSLSLTTLSNDDISLEANVNGGASILMDANGIGNIGQTAGLVEGTSLSLLSGSGSINLNVNVVNLTASTTGDVTFVESNELYISAGGVSGNNISINTLIGNITVGGLISGATVTINSAGAILDDNGAGNNLNATAGATLLANTHIGTKSEAFDVVVSGGPLSVRALGKLSGVSINIKGSVSPSNTLNLLNSPPGSVLFNDKDLIDDGLDPATNQQMFGYTSWLESSGTTIQPHASIIQDPVLLSDDSLIDDSKLDQHLEQLDKTQEVDFTTTWLNLFSNDRQDEDEEIFLEVNQTSSD
jgi:fibronectin-binding autotransporter adhesin